MRNWINFAISLALLLVFSYVSSNAPEYFSLFFIGYLVVIFALTALMAGRSATTLVRDMEYIKKGKVIVHVTRDRVERLKSKDRELEREIGAQTKSMMLQPLVFLAVLMIFFMPGLRDAALKQIAGFVGNLTSDPKTSLFIAYACLYGTFMAVSYLVNFLTSMQLKKLGGKLEVPRYYTVTERGLILEGRMPLKAPIDLTDLKVNTRRRFVEIKVKQTIAGSKQLSRIRLYYDSPRELENYLKSLAKEGS